MNAVYFMQGNLEKAVFLSEYGKTHDIKSIDDFLSVSMNVHDDGNVLEIVGMCCKLTKFILNRQILEIK